MRVQRSLGLLGAFCLVSFVVVVIVERANVFVVPSLYEAVQQRLNPPPQGVLPFSKCPLPNFDPWNEQMLKFHNPVEDKLAGCNRSFTPATRLVGGILEKTEKDLFCWGRCLNRKTEWENNPGPWLVVDASVEKFSCDIVESRCSTTDDIVSSHYGMLHSQIAESAEIKKAKKDSQDSFKKYSVHVLLIDSTSANQAQRNFVKTLAYLEKSMGAITFPFLNKVGQNSRPNAVPLLFGKRFEDVRRGHLGLPDLVEENPFPSCNQFIDNETFLLQEYAEKGYVSMMSSDWVVGPVHWPNCKGWKNQPVDHYFKPYLAANERPPEPLKSTHSEKNCIDGHQFVLRYLKAFVDSYDGYPKVSWNWFNLAHSEQNAAIRSDIDFYRFLMTNRAKLDNAFVFFIGDHGLRVGSSFASKMGSFEANNPMLTISVPKELRVNQELMDTMRENAKKLHSTFDLRATFVDIHKYQPASNWTDRSPLQMEGEEGQSLLRNITGERNCRQLPIPLEYCICQHPKEQLNSSSEIWEELGRAVIIHVNDLIFERNLTEKCATWEYKKVESIMTWVPETETKTYEVRVKSKSNHAATFQVLMARPTAGNYRFSRLQRIDQYRNRGKCVDGMSESICDCLKNT